MEYNELKSKIIKMEILKKITATFGAIFKSRNSSFLTTSMSKNRFCFNLIVRFFSRKSVAGRNEIGLGPYAARGPFVTDLC